MGDVEEPVETAEEEEEALGGDAAAEGAEDEGDATAGVGDQEGEAEGSVRGSQAEPTAGAGEGGGVPETNLANELAESISADEKFAITGFGKEELVEMFTMAIKRIDEKRKIASYCPVCTRRSLPKTPEENGHVTNGHSHGDTQAGGVGGGHEISVPGELLENVPNKSSKEKKVESWLRNKSDNKSFVEIDLSDLDEINDGFTRMFDRVAVDYRMNMIRGICGRMCVEYDLETGLATSINGSREKWRFDWRAKAVKASRPIMVLDESVKERMVIALCREMKRQDLEDPSAAIDAPGVSSDIQM